VEVAYKVTITIMIFMFGITIVVFMVAISPKIPRRFAKSDAAHAAIPSNLIILDRGTRCTRTGKADISDFDKILAKCDRLHLTVTQGEILASWSLTIRIFRAFAYFRALLLPSLPNHRNTNRFYRE
jgi:hypothetical protein